MKSKLELRRLRANSYVEAGRIPILCSTKDDVFPWAGRRMAKRVVERRRSGPHIRQLFATRLKLALIYRLGIGNSIYSVISATPRRMRHDFNFSDIQAASSVAFGKHERGMSEASYPLCICYPLLIMMLLSIFEDILLIARPAKSHRLTMSAFRTTGLTVGIPGPA
jgi:hypothetical protein